MVMFTNKNSSGVIVVMTKIINVRLHNLIMILFAYRLYIYHVSITEDEKLGFNFSHTSVTMLACCIFMIELRPGAALSINFRYQYLISDITN